MAIRNIVLADHPILRKKAKKVEKVTPEIRRLIEDMIDTMRAAPGVGLAAPQIGVSQRILVIEYSEEEPEASDRPEAAERPPVKKKLYALVNPEITYRSPEMVEGGEGCLSIPGWMGLVDRHQAIEVRGLGRSGSKIRLKLEGWLARIFQHEIDHLDGILFTDRITSPDKLWRTPPPESEAEPADSKTSV
jgi:peptide deformylase